MLQSSTLSTPDKPTTNPPDDSWTTTEPDYVSGSTNTLYTVELTVMSNGTFSYSDVSKSSSYEAAKAAYNKAVSVNERLSSWCAENDTTMIDGAKIYTGSVTAQQLAANTITGDKIAANTITTEQIAAGAITANEIASETITGDKIVSKTLKSDQIDVEDIFAQDITATGTITGLTLKGANIYSGNNYYISDGTTDQRFVYFNDGTLKVGLIKDATSFDGAGFEFLSTTNDSGETTDSIYMYGELFSFGNTIYGSRIEADSITCTNLSSSGTVSTGFEFKSQRDSGLDWRFGSSTGTVDTNWFGFYDTTYGFHGGFYGPSHMFRAYGEIQSISANAFRAIYGNYGFIIRTDGASVYFLLTKNGDAYGSWRDIYPLNILLSDGTVQLGTSVKSSGIYNTTTSAAANMYISPQKFLKRSTSASKYKLDIKDIEQGDALAYNILRVSPRQWFDRSAIETYSEYLTDVANDTVDEEKDYRENDVNLNPYYGFIAEDLVEAGLSSFCEYKTNEDGTQELEGIQYDRLPILFVPILRDLVTCMQKILPIAKDSITDADTLKSITEIQNRFALFSDDSIIRNEYAVDIQS